MQSHHLGGSHSGELRRHGIATEGDRSDSGRAAENGDLPGGNRRVKGKGGVVGCAATIFHARGAGERHVHSEGASGPMSKDGSSADQVGSATADTEIIVIDVDKCSLVEKSGCKI